MKDSKGTSISRLCLVVSAKTLSRFDGIIVRVDGVRSKILIAAILRDVLLIPDVYYFLRFQWYDPYYEEIYSGLYIQRLFGEGTAYA